MSANMDELLAQAKVQAERDNVRILIDPDLTTANFPATTIRGGRVLLRQVEDLGLDAEGWHHTSEILDRMALFGYLPGNTIELAHLACTEWDMQSCVAALGAPWINEAWREAAKTHYDVVNYEFYGTIGVSPKKHRRWIHLEFINIFWDKKFLFLAVPASS